jgi:glycosyltransferase involved in cell wall biosynthesis
MKRFPQSRKRRAENMNDRSLLLVSYTFPPFGGVGVHRALSLVKYLSALGWKIHVITARNPSAVGSDPGLLTQVPESVTVHRTWTIDLPFAVKKALKKVMSGGGEAEAARAEPVAPGGAPSFKGRLVQAVKDFLSPDPQVLWLPTAIREAERVVRRNRIRAVLVTVPPYSSFMIGNALKKRMPDVALVSDIRDEWLTYYFDTLGFNRSAHARACAERVERETVEASDRIVTVTERARLEMMRRYPEQPQSKFVLNTNGYDPATFQDFRSRPNASGKVLLSYTGTVYAPADPTRFVEALGMLSAEARAGLLIRFIGYVENPVFRALLESRGEVVRLEGFLPQKKALEELEATDFVLLIWNDEINIPGKLYDYLGTGKPVIAMAHPDGEVWRIISETKAGWLADCRKPVAMAALLTRVFAERDGMLAEHAPDREAVRRYERPRRAAEYSEILESAIRERS